MDQIKQNKLFRIVIKHGILVPVAIISTLVSSITAVGIMEFCGEDYNMIAGVVLSFDCVISSLCIFLLFGFNDAIYTMLCWRIHNFCENKSAQRLEQSVNVGLEVNVTSTSTVSE